MFDKIPDSDLDVLTRLVRSSDHIVFDQMLEGHRYQDNALCIGLRAGPSISLESACHELAHFIEMEDDRIGIAMWGMRGAGFTEISGYGSVAKDFTTLKHVERECRVWAMQYVLQNQLFQVPVSVEELASSSPYLPDIWYLIGNDDEVKKWVSDKIKEYLPAYSLNCIVEKYRCKTDLLTRYFTGEKQ